MQPLNPPASAQDFETQEGTITWNEHWLSLEDIKEDSRFQPRASTSERHVRHLIDLLRTETPLEPIKVAIIDGEHYVVDGFHRLEAYRRTSHSGTWCAVSELTAERAAGAALDANATHKGMPLRRADKRNMFRLFMRAERHRKGRGYLRYSAIGKALGIEHRTIERWMWQDFRTVAATLSRGFRPSKGTGLSRGRAELNPAEKARRASNDVEAAFAQSEDDHQREAIIEEVASLLGRLRAGASATADF
jgi:hypothetical protein